MNDLNCKKPKPCKPEPNTPCCAPPTDQFSVCVGGRTLHWDGTRATLSEVKAIADGTYTSVTVVDGCIVDFGQAPVVTYTPPFCAPNPASCGDMGTAGTTTNTTGGVSTLAGNTITVTPNGLYAKTHIQGGTGVSVSGSGVEKDPYVVSAGVAANVTLVGRNGVEVATDEMNNTHIGLSKTGVKAGEYGGLTIDAYGRVTSVDGDLGAKVTAGAGLNAQQNGDAVNIYHDKQNLVDAPLLGGWRVTHNDTGHATDFTRAIRIDGGTYRFGLYEVTINDFGSVTGIRQMETNITGAGTFTTNDGKTVHYDETGRIYRVEANNSGSSSGDKPKPGELLGYTG